jgi:hypothetical protein
MLLTTHTLTHPCTDSLGWPRGQVRLIQRYNVVAEDGSCTSVIRKQVDLQQGVWRNDEHRRMSRLSFLVEAHAYETLLPAMASALPALLTPRAFHLDYSQVPQQLAHCRNRRQRRQRSPTRNP